MTSTAHIHIVYDGPALTKHEMEVRELAPALMAIGEVLEEANLTLNGERTKINVKIRASFKTGSFGIDLSVVQSLADQIIGFLQSSHVDSAITLVTLLGFTAGAAKGLIYLIKWVGKRKIKRIIYLENGRASVEVDGDRLEVEERVIELYRNYKLRKALENTVRPLEQDGIDSIAITDDPG